MEFDRAGLQILDRGDCLDLLRTISLGRVGISWRAMPMILPVHFALERGQIMIATWDGSILSKATRGTVVAFEAEGPVGSDVPTWSVLVNGVADHVEPGAEIGQLERWADGDRPRIVSITTEQLTGRSGLTARPMSSGAPHIGVGAPSSGLGVWASRNHPVDRP